MSPEELKVALREVLAEEGTSACGLNTAGISCQEHIEHHLYVGRIKNDMGTITKAVLASLATLLTGGILGLIWLGIQSQTGVK